jgi:putative peptide zinc metalloprotease protein
VGDGIPPSVAIGPESLVLVLPSGVRIPIRGTITIGRDEGMTVRLEDRTVSRRHARIAVGRDGPMIEDTDSRAGVKVSGQRIAEPRRLIAGQELTLGNVVLRVEGAPPPPQPPVGGRPLAQANDLGAPSRPNATVVVPVDLKSDRRSAPQPAADGSPRPRLRSGWALKELEDDPAGDYVLRDLRSDKFMRMDAEDARLLKLIDGTRTVPELVEKAGAVLGPSGPGRLVRLIADLGERGMLDGVAPNPSPPEEPGLLARAFRPRERTFESLPEYFPRAYRRWGRMFFNPLVATCLVLLSLAGLVVFSYLVGARYGTPLLVAGRPLVGAAVFIAGRFGLVVVHEVAHGLALAHYGRKTSRAGLRLTLVFPYGFVDTNEAHLESRMHQIAISAAGPLSDLTLGAVFSIACAVSPRGSLRDVFFQLAFAGYVGAFFNINPFLDRDGYQMLSVWLREPHLKERAREELRRRITGRPGESDSSPVLARYAFAGLVWTAIGAGFIAVLSLRYYDRLNAILPHSLVLGGFIVFVALLLLPIPIALVAPLAHRVRYGAPEVNRVVR